MAVLVAQYADRHEAQSRQTVVRHGSLPEREVQTGSGAVRLKGPRVRECSGTGIRLHSALRPPYIRRSPRLEALLPGLSLQRRLDRGLHRGAPGPLGARGARPLPRDPPPAATRLARSTVAVASPQPDGQTVGLLLGRRALCTVQPAWRKPGIVFWGILGAPPDGHTERVGLWDGYRESAQTWKDPRLALKRRGLVLQLYL